MSDKKDELARRVHTYAIMAKIVSVLIKSNEEPLLSLIKAAYDNDVEKESNRRVKRELQSKGKKHISFVKTRLKSFTKTTNIIVNSFYHVSPNTALKVTIENKMIDKIFRLLPKLYEESKLEAEQELTQTKKKIEEFKSDKNENN